MMTTSASGKVYWNKRNSLGQFVRADGTNSSDRRWTLSAWRTYIEACMDSAERATRGHYASAAGMRRGVRFTSFFSTKPPMSYASQELTEWFEENGPVLSYSAFRSQCSEDHLGVVA